MRQWINLMVLGAVCGIGGEVLLLLFQASRRPGISLAMKADCVRHWLNYRRARSHHLQLNLAGGANFCQLQHPRPNFSSRCALGRAERERERASKSAFGLFVRKIYGQRIYQSDALLGRARARSRAIINIKSLLLLPPSFAFSFCWWCSSVWFGPRARANFSLF